MRPRPPNEESRPTAAALVASEAHNMRLDPCARRPQPRREGADLWTTPPCLIRALGEYVLPGLPEGPVWEPASGDGQLAAAIRRANEPCPSITQSPCHRIPGPLAGRKDPNEAMDLPV